MAFKTFCDVCDRHVMDVFTLELPDGEVLHFDSWACIAKGAGSVVGEPVSLTPHPDTIDDDDDELIVPASKPVAPDIDMDDLMKSMGVVKKG